MTPAADPTRRSAERYGRYAETAAAILLMLKGYRILDRRFRSHGGEIDLVVRRGRLIAFVEVKLRPTRDAALAGISAAGRTRIVAAATAWTARHGEAAGCDYRFDVVACAPWRWPHHVSGAFDAAA